MVASASMLRSQRDSISQMDSESRFRKQMPRVDHYASTLIALASGGHFEDSAQGMLPYHSRLLDTESESCSVRSRVDSETVSLASVDCSGDSDSKYSIDSRTSRCSSRSSISARCSGRSCMDARRHRRRRMQSELRGIHGYFQRVEETSATEEGGQLNLPGCLDRISRLRQRRPCRGERRPSKAFVPPPNSHKPVLSFPCVGIALATFTLSHVAQKATDFKSTVGALWLQLSGFCSQVGAAVGGPPRRVVVNPAMYEQGFWSVLKHAASRNVERRQDARLILLCALSSIMGVMCACGSLVLLIVSFTVSPDPQEPQNSAPSGAGMDSTGHENQKALPASLSQTTLSLGDPKTLFRVLIVMLISLSAGQGLAFYHPIRDALLCSF